MLTPGRTGIVRLGREVTARIPAGALYEPVFCRAERCPAPASDSTLLVLTSGYRILPVTTPLHRAMTVSVRAFVPENLHPHTVLAARNAKGRLTCIGGKYADGAVTATTRTTGELFVVADTIPPRIRPLFTDGADLTRAPAMRFRVGDNFSGIASCTLFIDGKWLPCDRLPMQGTLIHLFEEPPARKSHSVRLTLTDACEKAERQLAEWITCLPELPERWQVVSGSPGRLMAESLADAKVQLVIVGGARSAHRHLTQGNHLHRLLHEAGDVLILR